MIRRDYKDLISLEGLKKYVSISTMTKKEIAEKAGIETSMLISLINGITFTRTDNIAKLAYALNCDIDDILEFKGIDCKPELQKYSKSPSLNIKCELSYQPLYEMFYDIYGVQYKKKLDEIFPKLRPVFQHKVQEERTIANKADDSQNGKACRLKIENEKPLTLPVVYEICRQLKCTPGCIFGYKGEYEEEKKPINLEEENLTSIYFDNNTKHIDVKLLKGNIYYISKERYLKYKDSKNLIDIGCLVVYDKLADDLWCGTPTKIESLPKEIYTYPLEAIDMSLEKPFYVNGDWHKSIFIVIRFNDIPYWIHYSNNECHLNKSEWLLDSSTKKRAIINGEFVKHLVPYHYERITSRMLSQCLAKPQEKDSYKYVSQLLDSKKEVFLFFKLDDSYEKISHIKYEDEKENYKAG